MKGEGYSDADNTDIVYDCMGPELGSEFMSFINGGELPDAFSTQAGEQAKFIVDFVIANGRVPNRNELPQEEPVMKPVTKATRPLIFTPPKLPRAPVMPTMPIMPTISMPALQIGDTQYTIEIPKGINEINVDATTGDVIILRKHSGDDDVIGRMKITEWISKQ